jgi:hypothetical protein
LIFLIDFIDLAVKIHIGKAKKESKTLQRIRIDSSLQLISTYFIQIQIFNESDAKKLTNEKKTKCFLLINLKLWNKPLSWLEIYSHRSGSPEASSGGSMSIQRV